jgi:DNA-binding response OmpR family regulator
MTTALLEQPLVEEDVLMGTWAAPDARVIVVEDDAEMRLWVEEILADEGYRVRTAPDALSSLMFQLREPADVVITDWKMPGMDGLGLLEALHRCSPGLPVIIVTAYPEDELVRRVQDEGAFSCITKPFRRAQLLAHVQGALHCSRLGRTAQQTGGARNGRTETSGAPEA